MNRREFAERFQAVHGRLWLIAAGMIGDRTEAEDIVQEAAIIAFRKLSDFRAGTSFSAWLAQIVRHCSANYRRKVSGRRTYAADPESFDQKQDVRPAPADGARVSEELEDAVDPGRLDLDDEMMAALAQLSSEARCCLLLRVIEDLSYVEISELLRIPEGTAMSHVFRSKKSMRARLSRPPRIPNEP